MEEEAPVKTLTEIPTWYAIKGELQIKWKEETICSNYFFPFYEQENWGLQNLSDLFWLNRL